VEQRLVVALGVEHDGVAGVVVASTLGAVGVASGSAGEGDGGGWEWNRGHAQLFFYRGGTLGF
jgi:hypothetical protein